MDILRLRDAVWEEWMDTERVVRYLSALSKKYIWRARLLKGAILLLGLGNIASYLGKAPTWVDSLAGASLVIAVVLEVVWELEKKVAAISICKEQFSSFCNEWSRLWREVESQYNSPESDALEAMNTEYSTFMGERQTLEKWFSAYDIPPNDRINKEAAQLRDKYYATAFSA